MSDSGFREIQLSGKHVVFLFMAGAVAAVAIFLLGVSVGRGVTKPGATAQTTPSPADVAATAAGQVADQQSTTPKPGELGYHEALLGKGDPKSGTPTPSPAASPATPPAAPVKAASTPAPTSTPGPKPSTKPDAKTPAAGAPYFVQVNAFNSRSNADRNISDLKAKGITAKLVDEPGTNPRYKVKVGPYDKAAADAMKARLRKEGFPSATVIR